MTEPSRPQSSIHIFKPPTAVVYSVDYEPISHIPMSKQMYEYFMQYELVRFPVQVPIDINEPVSVMQPSLLYAEIAAMRVHSTDGVRLILIAKDDTTALLLNNSFLPGQTKEVNFIKTKAFYAGMVHAIMEKKK